MDTILLLFGVALLTYVAHLLRRIAMHLDAQELRYLKWHDSDHPVFTREEIAQQRASMINSMDMHDEAQANLNQVRNELGPAAGMGHPQLREGLREVLRTESDATSGLEEYRFLLEANARVAAGQQTIAQARQEWEQRFGPGSAAQRQKALDDRLREKNG
jgi:hypothetical protein